MKIRHILSSQWFRFGVPLLLLSVILVVRQRRQDVLFANYVINPASEKYDPDLSAWVLPITTVGADTVTINLGDRAGAANSIGKDVLFVLSPTLRMHKEAKIFVVSWYMLCCTDGGTSDGGQELIYHRDSGEVIYHSKGVFASKAYNSTKMLASGVDDAMIHNLAAKTDGSYEDLGK